MRSFQRNELQVRKGKPAIEELQKKLLQEAFENRYALAIWQLPNTRIQHCILDFSGKPAQQHLDLEDSRAGFAVSPFLNKALKETYFIQADIQLSFDVTQWTIQEDPLNTQMTKNEKFIQSVLQKPLNTFTSAQVHQFLLQDEAHTALSTLNAYESLVQKGIGAIQEGDFLKVVLSRTRDVSYQKPLDFVQLFQALSQTYPSAFRYFFHIPEVGTWMGASPETLISVDKEQLFRTMALAGTQAFQPNKKLSEVAWTQKEIEEQAIVGRYIINCFKKIRLREFDEEGPKTVVAGNLMYLCTRYTVDMQACNFPQLGTVMMDLLHPTSAVCGMPKAPSLDFILRHEKYDRSFYSGFLGPVNILRESHIFVNLRCVQFLQDSMRLYAGAGITEDSNPEKEWKETEMKCDTLARIIQSL